MSWNEKPLGPDGLNQLLERGEDWQLAPVLAAGGALVFPHAGIVECGHQQAACVQRRSIAVRIR